MTTFNAGAVEANLTLGRSSWVKDLRLTKKEIADLENTTITIGIDADADNALIQMSNVEALAEDFDGTTYSATLDADAETIKATLERLDEQLDALDARTVSFMLDADTDNAYVQLSLLNQELDSLDNDTVTIPVDVDSSAAETKLIGLATFINTLMQQDVDIQVDVDGYPTAIAQMATLEAQIATLNGQDIDIDVDVDRAMLAGLVGSGSSSGGGGSLGLLKILIYAIIALSPILVVATGAMTAAIVGFAAAVSAALGPVLVLGVGIAGLAKRFSDAKPKEMTNAMLQFRDAMRGLKDAWDEFLDAIEVQGFNLMAQAVNTLAMVLPTLAPLFNAVAKAMVDVLGAIQTWINSPEYEQMLAFFMDFGIDMLESFLQVGGNLIRFFGYLFEAMAPFTRTMMKGLEDLTRGWLEWSRGLQENEGFQTFLDNAAKYGPMVLDMLGSLLAAFINLGRALEPFAGPMLTGLITVFDFIANLDPDIMTPIIAALAGLWLGFHVLVPVIQAVFTALEVLPAVLGLISAPVLIVTAAIAGLVATVVYLWRTSETFRNAVIRTWQAIRETVAPIVEDISRAIRSSWGSIVGWAKAIWGDIKSIVTDAMIIIQQITRGVMAVIRFLWRAIGKDIIQVVRGMAQVVGSIVRGLFGQLKNIFSLIKNVLTGNWKGAWEDIKNIGRTFVQAVIGIGKGFKDIFAGLFRAMGDILVNLWRAIWPKMREAFSAFGQWIRGAWDSLIGFFRGLGSRVSSAVSGIWDGIASSFKNTINSIIGWWNNLSFSVDIPNKIPGLPDSFSMGTPNVPYLAEGAYLTRPTLAVVGERDPEIVAPEPKLREIVRDNSGGNIDYERLAMAIALALGGVFSRMGVVTRDEILALIKSAGVQIDIDATGDGDAGATKLANKLMFALRTLGYGTGEVA